MFEAAEVGRKLSKSDYKAQVPQLRSELLAVQQELLQAASFPVIVLFAGVDTAGKGETVNLLNEWMDPRWIITRGYTDPSSDERERPRLWRYWRDLPPHGRIAIFLSAWYSSPILDRVARRTSTAEFDSLLDQVAAFERTLTDDGAVIVKFWMHLSKKAQKERLKKFEKDPLQRWRVTEGAMEALGDVRQVRERRRSRHSPDQHRRGTVAHRRGRGRALSNGRRGHAAS